MKKGISLPINVVVILVIAIIVMLGIVIFFTGGFSGSSSGLNCESMLRTGCTQFTLRGGCEEDSTLTNNDVSDMKNLVDGLNCTLGGTLQLSQVLTEAKKHCCNK